MSPILAAAPSMAAEAAAVLATEGVAASEETTAPVAAAAATATKTAPPSIVFPDSKPKPASMPESKVSPDPFQDLGEAPRAHDLDASRFTGSLSPRSANLLSGPRVFDVGLLTLHPFYLLAAPKIEQWARVA